MLIISIKVILLELLMLDLLLSIIDLKITHQVKNKYAKTMPVAWHVTRWWGWCKSEDKKKEIEPFLWLMKSKTKFNWSWKSLHKVIQSWQKLAKGNKSW